MTPKAQARTVSLAISQTPDLRVYVQGLPARTVAVLVHRFSVQDLPLLRAYTAVEWIAETAML